MKTIEAPAAERVSTPIFEQLREEFGFTQLIAEITGESEQDDTAEDTAQAGEQAEGSDDTPAAADAVTETEAVDSTEDEDGDEA
ncbi:hypothetical protein SAMN05216266_104177 [Amycolatopsis marina]|uniref:Uncharacterized protein n=1 Tax=Amycolatopsis marina TaxID=490629 RepID=A0A1I0Y445_9PSEU|nr:hypothetical protein [Amycolatopsis marina]SFB07198.1 hypothetical protein SAMN05216266_104177 [Amycolatopsis marina]